MKFSHKIIAAVTAAVALVSLVYLVARQPGPRLSFSSGDVAASQTAQTAGTGVEHFTDVTGVEGMTGVTLRATQYVQTAQDFGYQAQRTYYATSANVRPLGRTVYENDVRWFSMSGSGIEFVVEGSYVDVELVTDASQTENYSHRPRVAVLVNDNVIFDDVLAQTSVHVSAQLEQYGQSAVIRVIKQSESMHSYCGVGAISAFCSRPVYPTPESSIKLEFIGDSITAGYGIDAVGDGGYSTQTQNFMKTYAYLTSKALAAGYSAVAYSGYGVVSGYTSSGYKNDSVIFTKYEKATDNKRYEASESLSQWQFSDFIPSAVIINLGTNDASYCRTQSRVSEFVAQYKSLLSLVRSKYSQAYILCVLGDMNNSLYSSIERAVQEYRLETGDSRVSASTIDFNMAQNDIVIDGHPGESSNLSAAADLTEQLRALIAAGLIY